MQILLDVPVGGSRRLGTIVVRPACSREARMTGAGEQGPAGALDHGSGWTCAIRSARRCCHTVSSIIATVNRKIIDPMT